MSSAAMKSAFKPSAGGASAAQVQGAAGARFALAVSALLASLGVSIANTALPAIASGFGSSFAETRWVVVAYLLAVTVTVVLAGRLGDIFGRRNVFLGGVALFTASSFLCALSPSLSFLVTARVLQGVGGAASIALSQALVTESVPAARFGSTMGLLGTTSAVGTGLGPSVGGFLIAGAGWRSVFFALFVVGSGAAALIVRYLPSPKGNGATGTFDFTGAFLLGGSVLLYSLGISASAGRFDLWHLLTLAAGVAVAWVFVRAEARSSSPLVRLGTLRNRSVLASLVMNSLVSTVMMSTLIVGPFYLSQSLGLSLAKVGLVMSIGPSLSILSGFPAGKLVDRFGVRKISSVGLAALFFGAAGVVLLPPLFGLYGYAFAIAFLSPGYQLFLAANSTGVMTSIGSEQKGVVSGLLNLSRNLGLVTGASGMGAVYSAASKAAENSGPALAAAHGLQATFFVAAGLALLALGLSLAKRT